MRHKLSFFDPSSRLIHFLILNWNWRKVSFSEKRSSRGTAELVGRGIYESRGKVVELLLSRGKVVVLLLSRGKVVGLLLSRGKVVGLLWSRGKMACLGIVESRGRWWDYWCWHFCGVGERWFWKGQFRHGMIII
jgi:hypothetical protein